MAGSRKPGPLGRSSKTEDPNRGNMIRALSPRPDRIGNGPTSITGHRPTPLRTIPPKPARQTTAATIQVLRQGSRGAEVQKLQRLLNVRLVPSPKLAVDGIFGPLTLQAVLQYQRGVSIVADGVVGKQTWYHLLKGDKATVLQPLIRPPQPSTTGPSAMAKSPTPTPATYPPSPTPVVGIWEWPLEDKFAEALRRTAPKLPESMRHEFEALLSPTSLAMMAGTLVIWAGSHAFGVGEVVDVLLLIGGAIFLGMAVFDVASELSDFLVITSTATDDKEFDEAASHLARAISIIGVAAFIALLAKVAKSRSGAKSGAAEAPSKQVAEPTAKPKPSPKAEISEPPPKAKRPAEPIAGSNVVKSKAGHIYDMTPGDPSKPARFGQRGVSPNFSKEGRFKGANIDTVVERLKNGELQPSDVPVDYIWVNGEKVVVNNRSATTLSKAGIPQDKWVMNDKTGKLPPSGPDSLPSVLERLDEMGGKPADLMPVRETGNRSGPIKEFIPVSK